MAARWPLLLVLVLAPGVGGVVLAAPGFTDEPCDITGGTGTSYETVGKLLTAMAPGQTGCLHGYPADAQPSSAGLYEEPVVTLGKPGITLRSYPGEVAQIKGRVLIVGPDITVSHLVLDGRNSNNFGSPRISALADNAKLIDNDITTRSTASCVWVDGDAPVPSAPLSTVEIRHNRIHDCHVAVTLESVGYVDTAVNPNVLHRATVTDNLIYDNQSAGVRLSPNVDYALVQRNVIDRTANSIQLGPGTDSNFVAWNVTSNPKTFNVGFQAAPGTYNVFSHNCVWKPGGGDGIDSTHTTTGWEFDQVVLTGNVTANPGYLGAASEEDLTISAGNDCYATTGSMSAAVTDGERPARSQAVNLRPNVLFIVTDDQRADTMGSMPNTVKWFKDGTPTDGSFSSIRGGTQYHQAFATTPVCCPSRASIFTGRFVHNNRVWTNEDGRLLESKTMLPWYLKQGGLGYYSAMYGKYLNGWQQCSGPGAPTGGGRHLDDDANPPRPPGVPPNFDEYSVFELEYHHFLAQESPSGDCVDRPNDHSTSYTFSKATSFVDQRDQANDSQPWFLHLATTAPHERGYSDAWAAADAQYRQTPPAGPPPGPQDERWGPSAWHQMTDETSTPPPDSIPYSEVNVPTHDPPHDPTRNDIPSQQFSGDDRILFEETIAGTRYPGLQQQMLRTLMFLDDKLDAFMQKLEEKGEADDTLAFFISDNGYLWREHGTLAGDTAGDCIAPNSPPTSPSDRHTAPVINPGCGMSGKARPSIEAVKIPFFVRWPDNPLIQANEDRLTKPVATIDLATTAMDALDRSPAADKPLDGRSLLSSYTRPWMLTEWNTEGAEWRSLVSSDTHFTKHVRPQLFYELYDLTQDAPEHNNLYGDRGQFGDGVGDDPWPYDYETLLTQYTDCRGTDPGDSDPDCP